MTGITVRTVCPDPTHLVFRKSARLLRLLVFRVVLHKVLGVGPFDMNAVMVIARRYCERFSDEPHAHDLLPYSSDFRMPLENSGGRRCKLDLTGVLP